MASRMFLKNTGNIGSAPPGYTVIGMSADGKAIKADETGSIQPIESTLIEQNVAENTVILGASGGTASVSVNGYYQLPNYTPLNGQVLGLSGSTLEWISGGGGGPITYSDVTSALGFTPYDSTNPDNYLTDFSGLVSGDITTALGFTPYDSTNPDGYVKLEPNGNFIANGQTVSGNNAIAIGFLSGTPGTSSYTIAMGVNSGYGNVGSYTIAMGVNSGYGNVGSESISIGSNAGFNNIGSDVILVGYYAGSNQAGSNVVAIGHYAGNNQVGSNVVAIGQYAGNGNTHSNVVLLGQNSTAISDNQISLNSGNGGVYINSSYVLPILDGAPGQIIKTDGSGVLTFTNTLYASDGVTPVLNFTSQASALTAPSVLTVNSGDVDTDTVINNLRTRINELENILIAYGLLPSV